MGVWWSTGTTEGRRQMQRNADMENTHMDPRTVAALYVEPDGVYRDCPGVDPWDEARDARKYAGPHPVVAHPPCQRWGRFWHGSTRKPHQFKLGDDGGCFAAALYALYRFGGVLEHPADSRAWGRFGITPPKRGAGWQDAVLDLDAAVWTPKSVWTCYVEQGHYGHPSRKPTWLLVAGVPRALLPDLNWTRGPQRLDPRMVERYGYEKARRIGVVAMVGGKDKTKIRNATPPAFRDVLLAIARSAT